MISPLAVFTVIVHESEKLLKRGCSFPVGIVSKAIRIGFSDGYRNKSTLGHACDNRKTACNSNPRMRCTRRSLCCPGEVTTARWRGVFDYLYYSSIPRFEAIFQRFRSITNLLSRGIGGSTTANDAPSGPQVRPDSSRTYTISLISI